MHFIKHCAIVFFIIAYFLHKIEAAVLIHNLTCPVTNSKFLKDVTVYLHADSASNEFFANFTIVKSFPQNSKVHMKVVKRSINGQYDESTPLKFFQPLCETVSNPQDVFWATFHKRFFRECPALPVNCMNYLDVSRNMLLNLIKQRYHSELR